MRRVRSLAWSVLAVAAAVTGVCATPAGAAPLPVHLGQVGTQFNTGSATAAGGCECTVAQFGDIGPTANSYAIPYDGVITASAFYLGETLEAGNTVQVQTVHETGATTGTVASEGVPHDTFGLTPKTVQPYFERLPAHAGDVLAARFHSSYFIQTTPYFFKTAAAGDLAGIGSPTAAGGSISTGGSVAERRLNLEAVLEPDEDGDGYGDVSQDLCPGSPIASSACSGSLVGSDMQGQRSAPPTPCTCMRVQTSLNGASTAAPFNGVVVRWRVLGQSNSQYRARVVSLVANEAGFLKFRALRSSAPGTATIPIGPLAWTLSTFPTRLPIKAGDYVALSGGGSSLGFQESAGSSTYVTPEEVGDGVVGTGQSHNGTFLYDADIEPDADADGYGDITQDSCPTAVTVHEGPCPAPPPAAGGGGGTGAGVSGSGGKGVAPTIGGLSVKPKSFRAKPLGRAPAHGKWGAKVGLTLSAAATVKLAIETKQGRHFEVVTTLTKKLTKGKRSIPLSGQYRHGGKLADLAPGAYRLSATAASAAGSGAVARTTFTVLPPA